MGKNDISTLITCPSTIFMSASCRSLSSLHQHQQASLDRRLYSEKRQHIKCHYNIVPETITWSGFGLIDETRESSSSATYLTFTTNRSLMPSSLVSSVLRPEDNETVPLFSLVHHQLLAPLLSAAAPNRLLVPPTSTNNAKILFQRQKMESECRCISVVLASTCGG